MDCLESIMLSHFLKTFHLCLGLLSVVDSVIIFFFFCIRIKIGVLKSFSLCPESIVKICGFSEHQFSILKYKQKLKPKISEKIFWDFVIFLSLAKVGITLVKCLPFIKF